MSFLKTSWQAENVYGAFQVKNLVDCTLLFSTGDNILTNIINKKSFYECKLCTVNEFTQQLGRFKLSNHYRILFFQICE